MLLLCWVNVSWVWLWWRCWVFVCFWISLISMLLVWWLILFSICLVGWRWLVFVIILLLCVLNIFCFMRLIFSKVCLVCWFLMMIGSWWFCIIGVSFIVMLVWEINCCVRLMKVYVLVFFIVICWYVCLFCCLRFGCCCRKFWVIRWLVCLLFLLLLIILYLIWYRRLVWIIVVKILFCRL